MKEAFDPDFEPLRFDMLIAQCLAGVDVWGEIVFGSFNQEFELDYYFSNFHPDCEEFVEASDFRYFLLPMLRDFMEYHLRVNETAFLSARVSIVNSRASVRWMNHEEQKAWFDERGLRFP